MSNKLIKNGFFKFEDKKYFVYICHKDMIERASKSGHVVNSGMYIYHGKSGKDNHCRNDIYVGEMNTYAVGDEWADRVDESWDDLEYWKKANWMYAVFIVPEDGDVNLSQFYMLKDVFLNHLKDEFSSNSNGDRYRILNSIVLNVDLAKARYLDSLLFIESIKEKIHDLIDVCFVIEDSAGRKYRRYVFPEFMRKMVKEEMHNDQVGIYLYFGKGGEDCGYTGTVYVGLSTEWPKRIADSHDGDVEQWMKTNLDTTVVFTPDESSWESSKMWSKEQLKYVEDRIRDMSEATDRYKVINSAPTTPGRSPQFKKNELEKFIICAGKELRKIGYPVFDYTDFS